MMSDALLVPPDTPIGEMDSVEETTPPDIDNEQIAKYFFSRVETSKQVINDRIPEWKSNIRMRTGTIGALATNVTPLEQDIRTSINPDWALTKTKTANLYSQLPTVQITHENRDYMKAVSAFSKALNFEIGEKRANVGVAMDEVLNDAVNASGIGAVIVGYAARFEDVQVPAVDPMTAAMSGLPPEMVPMTTVKRKTSDRFFVHRISPKDILTPAEFLGSNFDEGDFVGYRDRMSWAEGVVEFALKPEDKDKALDQGLSSPSSQDLRNNPERSSVGDLRSIRYTRVFYWRYRVDPAEPSFSAIWELVWVDGLGDTPVAHRPYKGQEYHPESRDYIGVCRFPLRLLTLTYITDNPIPPSDTAVGRPQVLDLQKSRDQMFANRDRSVPLRWYNVNAIDPEIGATLMRGVPQGMIPTNGSGDRVIGEIARASYPAEDFAFDRQSRADLMEMWQIGPNQLGTAAGGDTTKGEAELIQGNFATRIGQERNYVARFFLSIADTVAGLMVLYSDFPNLGQQEKQALLQAWDIKKVSHELVLKIRPDSTVLLDSTQRISRLERFLNIAVKSGFVNPVPILAEIAELTGLDPSEVLKAPTPPPPDQPSVSIRFTGKEDLYNPGVAAMLAHAKQLPTPEDLKNAKAFLAEVQNPMPPQPSQGPPEVTPHDTTRDAMPQWSLSSKIAQRSSDLGSP